METIAVIGTGISGMAAALRLHELAHLTLFERETWVGGHTNTVIVREEAETVPVDTGFMVYNEVTYPRLTRLFAELNVPTMPTEMSFGVYHAGADLSYCGSSLNRIFGDRRNLARPRFYGMLRDILRFNREAPGILDSPENELMTLDEFLARGRYGSMFRDFYLIPMTGAIWSTPPDRMLRFPARTLVRFLHNHGLLGVNTHFPWRTVRGGSREYRERLIAPFRDRIRTGCPARSVHVGPDYAEVRDAAGRAHRFDRVVIATHADEALALRSNPSQDEERLLGVFRYTKNPVKLHTDASVMPPQRRTWASWNYRMDPSPDGGRASTHYWMNSLQKVSAQTDYFVSVDDPGLVDPAKVLWEKDFTHPTFDCATRAAQEELPRLNQGRRVYYAGSYFRFGFHEDGLMSGLDAADAVLQDGGKRELVAV
ncbi:MAG: FAD-dependent oxidoreductase [Opitutales bacterium]|nr:FAD-dependent oxidoreductase [Opitutales bacterium]